MRPVRRAKGARAAAGVAAEHAREMARADEAETQGELGDRNVINREQLHGALDAKPMNEAERRLAGRRVEGAMKMPFRASNQRGQRVNADIAREVRRHVIGDAA